MAGKGLTISVILKAVDKATAPLRAVGKTAEKLSSPFKYLVGLHNKARLLMDRLGLGKITNAYGNMTNKVGALATKTRNLIGAIFGMSGAIGGAVGALYKITRAASDYGDSVWKTSQKIGMNVEAWQELRHAGELSGVEFDSLSVHLQRFGKNVTDAVNGSKSMSAWFQRAGVSVRDSNGKIKTTDTLLMELSDVFAKHRDGVKKTALAIGLFGRGGADLIPMLNSGKKGLAGMRKEARDLGIVMDEKTARASEAFNDNVSRMVKVVKGLVFNLGAGLIPIFNDLVVSVRNWIEANRELIKTKIREWVEDLKKKLPEFKKRLIEAANKIRDLMLKVSDTIDKFGGFQTIIKIVGTYLAVSFVASVAAAANAIIGLGATLLANPAGWIMIAIAAAAIGVYEAVKHWSEIWPVIKQIGHVLMTPLRLFGELIDYLTSFDLVAIGANLLKSLWNGIKSMFATIRDGFNAWIDAAKNFLGSINLFDIGAKIFGSLWEGMKNKWNAVKNWFANLSIGSTTPNVPGPGVPAPMPLLPGRPRIQPFGNRAAAAARGQTASSHAAVQIDFNNVPKGTKIRTKRDKGVDLSTAVKMGPSMATN